VHINTGIGIPQTRQFVRDTCKEHGWQLREIRAKEDCGQDFRQIVLENGFPGPPVHNRMYARLKERAVRLLVRETKVGHHLRDTVLLISGVRSQESQRRMGYVEKIKKEAARIWVAVIHDWSKVDCNRYMASQNLKRNKVVDLIHKSGECLCGAFAKPGELEELALWFPDVAKEIRELEKEVKAKGFPWGWEGRPARCKTKKDSKKQLNLTLCHSCDKEEEKQT